MKTKYFITGALIATLAVTPHHRARAQAKPQWVSIVCGILIIGIGAWVTYELIQMCRKIPDPKPDDQPDPPPPPVNQGQFRQSSTNSPTITMRLDDSNGVALWDATPYQWSDPVSGDPITAIMTTRIQSTVDFNTWNDEISILGYYSKNGTTMVYSRAGSPICTNYLVAGATNTLNLATVPPVAHKFYRLAAP